MKDTHDGSRTEAIDVPTTAQDSMHFSSESDSNEIEESHLQKEKHCEPKVSTERGITIDGKDPKYRTSVGLESLKRKKFSTENIEFPDSIEIDDKFDLEKADSSMNATQQGIKIEPSEDCENALDAIDLTGP
jgi:hypothetical protein